MKKRLISILILLMIVVLVIGLALPVMAATAVGPSPPSVIDWVRDNLSYILGLALAVSELLAATPWFKGNGILDYIIKGLVFLLRHKSGDGASGDEGYGQGT